MYKSKVNLGILGGGQLGRMMIEACIDFDVTVSVLDPDATCPCSHFCANFVCGDYNDFNTVYEFGKNLDVLTIEFENVNVDALEKLESEGLKVYPQPSVLRIIQDKGLQKQFYTKHEIPTADYLLLDSLDGESEEMFKKFLPFYQKLRKAGYDGKGVVRIESESDFGKMFKAASVLEKNIDFESEISVIVARSASGEIKAYPVVDQQFNSEANLVEFLYTPSRFSSEITSRAESLAIRIVEELGIVGILAVEMFVLHDGTIFVNEIAPRAHNSGHSTIEANVTSQFEQLLRAILGLPLGSTKLVRCAVMVNLLGEKGYEGDVVYEGLEEALQIPEVHVHLYGKLTTKPFRKMGHINICSDSLKDAMEKASMLKEKVRVLSK